MMDFDIYSWIKFFVIGISMAELMIQCQISELSQWIKDKIALIQPYPKKLQTLSFIPFWRKLLGKWFWVLSPLFLIIILGFRIHRFFASLVNCPYCLGFWVGLFTNHFYLNMDWITSIIFAPIVLVGVVILDKLHTHE